MICKFCGTESSEKNCPKCGMPMIIQPQQPRVQQPQAPQYAQPQAPQYAQPRAPQYAQPQAPQYAQSQAPQYAQPQAPQHAQPQAPQYAQPRAPQYAQPQAPQYAQPQAPQYAQPQAPQYAQPRAPQYAQPQAPQYAQPQAPQYAQPRAPQYAQPQQPRVQQPQAPQYAQQRPQTPPRDPRAAGIPVSASAPAPAQSATATRSEQALLTRSPLRLKNVVWPALALLLPLLYLVLESFAILGTAFGDSALLTDLFSKLTGGFFSGVSITELAQAIAPEQATLYELISPLNVCRTVLANGTEGLAAALILAVAVALPAALCLLSALALLVSGGRVLRFSLFNTLLAFSGAAAVSAPLLGYVSLQLYYTATLGAAGANMAMQSVAISPEALMLLCLLFCVLRPALGSLRKLSAKAAGQEEYPLFPYRMAAKRSFGTLKLVAMLLLGVGILLPVLYLFLPVWQSGSALDLLRTLREGGMGAWFGRLFDMLKCLFSATPNSVSVMDFAQTLLTAGFLAALCVAALAVLRVIIALIRLGVMGEDVPAHKKSAKRFLRSLGARVRDLVMAPFLCVALFGITLTVLVLFCSPMLEHLDLSNVEEALGAYYVTVFYVKQLGCLSATFTLLGLSGAVLWHNLRQVGLSMVVRTGRKTKKY